VDEPQLPSSHKAVDVQACSNAGGRGCLPPPRRGAAQGRGSWTGLPLSSRSRNPFIVSMGCLKHAKRAPCGCSSDPAPHSVPRCFHVHIRRWDGIARCDVRPSAGRCAAHLPAAARPACWMERNRTAVGISTPICAKRVLCAATWPCALRHVVLNDVPTDYFCGSTCIVVSIHATLGAGRTSGRHDPFRSSKSCVVPSPLAITGATTSADLRRGAGRLP
jgi:hypothetical protein